MAIRTLPRNLALDAYWADLTYTLARLRHDADAADRVEALLGLVTRVLEARAAQWAAWAEEIAAQAGVDAADDRLDGLVADFARDLIYRVPDREDPRFRLYFSQAPSALIALGLQSEVEALSTWPGLLGAEAEPELAAWGPRFEAALAAGRAALAARTAAGVARAHHRVHQIDRLVDDLNAARLALYGELLQRGVARGKPRGWARAFFPRGKRAPRELPGGAPEASAPPVPGADA